jgi:hypothetical protein
MKARRCCSRTLSGACSSKRPSRFAFLHGIFVARACPRPAATMESVGAPSRVGVPRLVCSLQLLYLFAIILGMSQTTQVLPGSERWPVPRQERLIGENAEEMLKNFDILTE